MNAVQKVLFSALFTLIATGLLAFGIQAQELPAQPAAGDDVVSVINETGDHTIFASLVEEAELGGVLREQGPFTVLAPTDAAFEPMGDDLAELRQNPQQLQNVVINHLFQGEADASHIEENFGIEVKEADMDASNGTVHSIGEVLLER